MLNAPQRTDERRHARAACRAGVACAATPSDEPTVHRLLQDRGDDLRLTAAIRARAMPQVEVEHALGQPRPTRSHRAVMRAFRLALGGLGGLSALDRPLRHHQRAQPGVGRPARHESGQLQPWSWHQRRQPLHELQPWGEPVRHRRTDTSMRLRSWLAGPSWPSASPAGPAGMRSGAERSRERQPRVLDKGGRIPAGLAQMKCPGSARARAVVGTRSSRAGSARLPTSSATRNTLPGWRHRRH